MNRNETDARDLFGKGVAAYQAGQMKLAIERWTVAVSIFSELGFNGETANCEMGIGCAFYSLGDLQQALDFHRSALSSFQKLVPQEDGSLRTAVKSGPKSLSRLAKLLKILSRLLKLVSFSRQFPKSQEVALYESVAKCTLYIGKDLDALGKHQQAASQYKKLS